MRGRYLSKDLKKNLTLTTAHSGKLIVKKEGETVTITDVMRNAATVNMADITATNGIVHSVDTVLMPGAMTTAGK